MRKANTDLIMIPGGMTSQQVLDTVVKKNFKDHLSQPRNDWFLKGNYALTPGGKLRSPQSQCCKNGSLTAWERISSESIVAGFKNCCISTVLHGTENDFPWQDFEIKYAFFKNKKKNEDNGKYQNEHENL
jgi:hypothetical protein